MTAWVVVLATGVVAFATKLAGHVVPERWTRHQRLLRINTYVPVVLLSSLVVAEGLVAKTHVVLDHRLGGLVVAVGALFARLPFPIVVLAAAGTSAVLYHLH